MDLNLLLGNHLTDEDHIYYYFGVGYFSDEWSFNARQKTETVSGVQLPFGIGYNVGKFSIEAQYTYRLSSAYDNALTYNDGSTYFGSDTSAYGLAVKALYSF